LPFSAPVQGRSTSTRCRPCSKIRSFASGRNPAHARRRTGDDRSWPARSRKLEGADVVYCNLGQRADRRLAGAGHPHQRRRRVPNKAGRTSGESTASRFFVDRRESTLNEAGDYRVAAAESGFGPEHIIGELGELLNGTVEGRRSADELTVFKSMGIAVEDLAAAQLCVARARERGAGVEVDF
jgi:hypothetical protein